MQEFISRQLTYAVVGASRSREKYGNKVLRNLTENGYTAIPVNPKATEIEGLAAYPNLSAVKGNIDVVVMVTPPHITEKILVEVNDLGIGKVWMQPGSESDQAIAKCTQLGIDCISNACIMVQRRKLEELG